MTKITYAAKSWPVAVKVVDISDKQIWIDPLTAVARIVEYGYFPRSGRFVRPGKRQYQEWQQLIYENTLSAQAQMRADRLAQLQYEQEPPCVQTSSYPWSSKILPRPANVTAEVRLARLCSVLAPSKVTYSDPAGKDVIFEMKDVAVQTDEFEEEAAVQDIGVDTADLNDVVSAREAAVSGQTLQFLAAPAPKCLLLWKVVMMTVMTKWRPFQGRQRRVSPVPRWRCWNASTRAVCVSLRRNWTLNQLSTSEKEAS